MDEGEPGDGVGVGLTLDEGLDVVVFASSKKIREPMLMHNEMTLVTESA